MQLFISSTNTRAQILTGVYIVPYNLIFFPLPIFKNLDFLSLFLYQSLKLALTMRKEDKKKCLKKESCLKFLFFSKGLRPHKK